jgi:DNA-binding transcriptional MerR regulator
VSRKANLLSIGEVSKYSGASIRSLRYYEQMNILKPAHIDIDSGYRYYSVDQLHHVGMIIFCIKLGIPLKELALLIDDEDVIDIRTLLVRGKALAEEKLKSIQRGLRLFGVIERQMDLAEMHTKGMIYPRKIEEKMFFVQRFEKSQADFGQLDIVKAYMEMPFTDDEFEVLTEYGVMYEHTPAGVEHYVFVEVPKRMKVQSKKIIPAGIYHCCLGDDGRIDKAADIFQEQLSGKDSFIAIETEIMASGYEVGKPFSSELRIIAL